MARESTLDEFVGAGSDAAAEDEATETDAAAKDGTDETGTGAVAEDEATETAGPSVADATPATPTCGWRAGGVPCADCGASVEWLWTDGDGEGGDDGRRVCAGCKDW